MSGSDSALGDEALLENALDKWILGETALSDAQTRTALDASMREPARTRDESHQRKELLSFVVVGEDMRLTATQQGVIRDFVREQLAPALEWLVANPPTDQSASNDAAWELEGLLTQFVREVYAVSDDGALFQGIVSDPEVVSTFRRAYEADVDPGAVDALYELFVKTGDRSVAVWLVLVGIENHDFDEKVLAAFTEAGRSDPLIRHKYDLYLELGGGFSGGLTAPVIPFLVEPGVNAGASHHLFRVMHTLQIFDPAIGETGDYVDAQPNFCWQVWFTVIALNIEPGVAFGSVGIPGIEVDPSLVPPQWANGPDRSTNSSTAYAKKYYEPEFFTSGLLTISIGSSSTHAVVGNAISLEYGIFMLDDGQRTPLTFEDEASVGWDLTLDIYQLGSTDAHYEMGMSFPLVNSIFGSSPARDVLDYFYELRYPKEQILARAADQPSIRCVIGFATDKYNLGSDDYATIATVASLMQKFDIRVMQEGKSAMFDILVTGSHSMAVSTDDPNGSKNRELAANRATAAREALMRALDAVKDQFPSGRQIANIILGEEPKIDTISVPTNSRPGANDAVDRTAIIDVYLIRQEV